MNWETRLARNLFPREQTFMARRKLRLALGVMLVGLVASGVFVGMVILAQQQK